MRYFVRCNYLGTEYVGWQRQPNGLSVQEVIENAMSTLLRQQISIVGCGRTDAGVHAHNYVFHVDLKEPPPDGFLRKVNRFLPLDIGFDSMTPVDDEMHARHSARSRSYTYYLSLNKDPFRQHETYYFPYPDPPDFDVMNELGRVIMTHKTFATFCKTGSDTPHFLCDLTRAEWSVDGHTAAFHITGNRFLRGMVRLITGAMLRVGRGKMTIQEVESALDAGIALDKSDSAPAHGLHLVNVRY